MREITNPLAAMQVSHNQRTMPQNFGANFNLDVDLLPGLKFKTTYGAEWVFNSIKNVTPVYELNATSKNATSKVEDKKREYVPIGSGKMYCRIQSLSAVII